MTAFLFFMATIFVVVFIGVKILVPGDDRVKIKEIEFDAKRDFNIGQTLLGLGPVVAGFGLIGLIAQNWSAIDLGLRLVILLIATLASVLGGLVMQKGFKDIRFKVLGEALTILGSFTIGATLYVLNDLLKVNGGNYFGFSEMLGFWTVLLLPLVYVTRSIWILVINLLVQLVWLATYLGKEYNFVSLFGIDPSTFTVVGNRFLFLLLPVVASVVLIIWHIQLQQRKLGKNITVQKAFTYIIGLMATLTVGALVWRGVVENDDQFAYGSRALAAGLVTSVVTLILFAIDFVGKATQPKYNISYLALGAVLLSSVIGLVSGFPSAFVGLYFLQTAFTVWILTDYLRNHNQVAGILFYVFNAVQLIALATNREPYSLFQLILLLSIMVYAATVHFRRLSFVYYVGAAGVITALVKMLVFRLNFNWMLFVVGLILMSFGVYYTQTRGKLIKDSRSKEVKMTKEEVDPEVVESNVEFVN
ncbi:MAG: hypothetical protein OHK0017_03810 [Patescibacteria group bacterium]